jgi:hypothetical protein
MTKTTESISKDKSIFIKFEGSTKYIFIAYFLLCILFIKTLFDVESYYKQNNHPTTVISEYLLLIPGFLFSMYLYKITEYFFSNVIERNMIDKNKYNETKDQHKYRIVKILYSIFYYTISSTVNFYLIRTFQRDHLPKFFGGGLEIRNFIESWPLNVNKYVRYFFILSIGHHLDRTYEQLTNPKKYLNFWTMLLHHVLTINLMIICFAHRQFQFGIPILLIHDITDIFLSLMKFFREMKNLKKFVMPAYFVCLIVWFITRNYIFNKEVIYPLWFIEVPKIFKEGNFNASHLFASMGLGILMILNSYWLLALLHAGFKKIFYNVEASIHEGEKDKEE